MMRPLSALVSCLFLANIACEAAAQNAAELRIVGVSPHVNLLRQNAPVPIYLSQADPPGEDEPDSPSDLADPPPPVPPADEDDSPSDLDVPVEPPAILGEIDEEAFLENDHWHDDHHGDYCEHGHDLKHDRPDTHAPAGLMGDHVHKCGDWMIEYKYMLMTMDGNRVSDQRVSDLAALDASGVSFVFTPTRMTMQMHMLHFMYGWTDNITLYVMPMFVDLSMDHLRRPGSPPALALGPTFQTANDGFGDLPFGFLWRVYESDSEDLIFNIGLSAPTGNITAITTAPAGTPVELPFPMRLGSGSFAFRPGITYKKY